MALANHQPCHEHLHKREQQVPETEASTPLLTLEGESWRGLGTALHVDRYPYRRGTPFGPPAGL